MQQAYETPKLVDYGSITDRTFRTPWRRTKWRHHHGENDHHDEEFGLTPVLTTVTT